MLHLVFVEHLLVHADLLGEGLLDPVPLLLHLAQPVLEKTVVGCGLAHLARLLLDLFEGSHLLEQHVVGQLAGSVAEVGVGALPELVRGKIFEFGWGLLARKTTV